MEHRDAKALLETAAVEPAGFERLAAGDTPEAASLAAHLAGCPECAAEFEHLRGLALTLRATVRELPPPDLRERTIALVAAAGRPRAVDRDVAAATTRPTSLPPADVGADIATAARPPRRVSRSWAFATAASLVLAVAGVAGWLNARSELDQEQAATAMLVEVTEATVRVGSQPDAEHVTLGGTAPAIGEAILSVASREVVVLAEGLPEPEAGREYRCWVEIDGSRQVIGTMQLSAGVAAWAGWTVVLEGAGAGTRFGVSLVETGADAEGEPVLVGEL